MCIAARPGNKTLRFAQTCWSILVWYTAISRKVVGKMYTRQSRKVIWDIINTLFLTLQLSNLLALLSFSTRKHTSMASRIILSDFFEEQWIQNHPHYLSGLSRAHSVKNLSRVQKRKKKSQKNVCLKDFWRWETIQVFTRKHHKEMNAYISEYTIRKIEDNNEDFDFLWWPVLNGIKRRRINHVALWKTPINRQAKLYYHN